MTRRHVLLLFGGWLGGLGLSACAGAGLPAPATGVPSTPPPAVTAIFPPTPPFAATPTGIPPTRLPPAATATAVLTRVPTVIVELPTATPGVPISSPLSPGEMLIGVDQAVVEAAAGVSRQIELSEPDAFAKGHLPGAVNVRWQDLQLVDSSPGTIESWRGDMQEKLGAWGLRTTDSIIVYDDGTLWAARLWWILKQLGHREARVLDGGKPAWEATGHPLSTEAHTGARTQYIGRPDESALIGADELAKRLYAPDLAIVDARTAEEYHGRDNSGAGRVGHIPGAVNVPYTLTARAEQPRTFLAAAELKALYVAQGVTPDRECVAYCSTGVRSAVTYFSLRLLGYPRVRLYSASYAEWGNRPDLPVEL